MSAKKSFYELFNGKKDTKKFGGVDQEVKLGWANTLDLAFETVDPDKGEGNPRFWNTTRQLQKKKLIKGGLTDALHKKLFVTNEINDSCLNRIKKSIKALVEGMIKSGEPADPLIVDSKGRIVEGTRRGLAAQIILHKELGDGNFEQLPVIVLSPNIPREDILAYIAQIHAAKTKSTWDSVDRAAAAAQLADEFGWTIPQIAVEFNWNHTQVKSYLNANKYLVQYRATYNDFSPKIFTHFYKLATNSKLLEMIEDADSEIYDPNLKANFMRWINEKKIKDCRHVHYLASKKENILAYPKAIQVLETHGSSKALDWISKNADVPVVGMTEDFAHELRTVMNNPASLKKLVNQSPKWRSILEYTGLTISEIVQKMDDLDAA